jgi:Leucine-rich repeat (LRR) protein
VQDPDEFIPAGVTERYKKELTELFCGNHEIERLDSEAMSHFPNLEVLWLNDNRISKLKGLEHNFRIKHLYLHNNNLATVTNGSCALAAPARHPAAVPRHRGRMPCTVVSERLGPQAASPSSTTSRPSNWLATSCRT